MTWLRGLAFRLRSILRSTTSDRELDEEIGFHLDMQSEHYRTRGLAPAAARRAAERDLGGVTGVKDGARDVLGGRFFDALGQDVRYAFRSLRAHPGFAALAILTLGIGLGANTAIFSVVDAALLRPLPFAAPEQLMAVSLRMPIEFGSGMTDMVWSYPKYRAFVELQHSFAALALHAAEARVVGDAEGSEQLPAETVSADYFRVLRIAPRLGRAFSAEEDRPGTALSAVVISDGFWRRRYGADPGILGRQLQVGRRSFTVVGVMPRGFAGMSGNAELWVPVGAVRDTGSLASPSAHNLELVGRLKPGVTPAAVKAGMAEMGRTIDRRYPDDGKPWSAAAYTLDELRIDPALRRSVVVLAAGVALVLCIACVNIASLLLARGAARRRELAVRLAIGADRSRIVRQLLTEGLVLSCFGMIAAVALALVATHALAAAAPQTASSLSMVQPGFTRLTLASIRLDGRALLWVALLAVASGLAVGIVPALIAAHAPPIEAMRAGSSSAPFFSGFSRLSGRAVLVIVEVALAVVLVVASLLTINSFSRLLNVRAGYDPDRVLTLRLAIAPRRYSDDSAVTLWNDVLTRVGALPGVTNVAVSSCAPIGDHCEGTSITPVGRTVSSHVSYLIVSPGYFAALRIPLRRGRDFGAADDAGTPAMIINETAARTIWGADDPLRTPLKSGIQIVGVVGDVRYEDLEEAPKAAVFVPLAQNTWSRMMLLVRTSIDPARMVASVRREIRAIDPHHVIGDVRTLRERIGIASARSRFSTTVLAIFAGIAVTLAAIGIYGVLALAVTQRRRELGVRVALGAGRRQVLTLILRQALGLAACGLVLGLFGAFLAARVLSGILYDVSAVDPATYALTGLILTAAVFAAAALPALRAMQVSPMEALRGE